MKEQKNYPEELDEMQASNLSDREFGAMIIKTLDSTRKDIKTIEKGQSKINNALSEINNTLEGISSRLDETEDQIGDLEDKVEKNS